MDQTQAETSPESHQIKLMGRDFRVRSSDEPGHVQAVADYVNGMIDEVSQQKRHTPVQNVLLLASMAMADELFKERARLDLIRQKIRAQSRALLDRLSSAQA